uniref:Putative RNA-directed DNA polymerase, eukaryota, reverse transcriptase zinc-binding domain protein n=1 Tax=Tanacetum cinerariifolium TaxID=118510 RepID=A0A6L2KUZ6_TANCI|nr:putative RNA-directed DNA polymerase, eukaryota, reverse transcriptase zinc-binding domain protein [Tanacetum cinerariifolium]
MANNTINDGMEETKSFWPPGYTEYVSNIKINKKDQGGTKCNSTRGSMESTCSMRFKFSKVDFVRVSELGNIIGWLDVKLDIYMVNVYAPQDEEGKQNLWRFITEFINALYFNEFIANGNLVDIPMGGYKFTRVDKSCTKGTRLDRFLIADSTWNHLGLLTAVAIDRMISDHHPILLRRCTADYGPIPFRFYHSWFQVDGFDKVVADFRSNGYYRKSSSSLINFKNKLQSLKSAIKGWVNTRRSRIEVIDSLREELRSLDLHIDVRQGLHHWGEKRMKLVNEIHKLEHEKKTILLKKSRIKWCMDGDENSKFFHGTINKKRKQLLVWGIKSNGQWVEEPMAVKQTFLNHFWKKFLKSLQYLILLEVNGLRCDKSPGPDGFTFGFIKRYWNTMKNDIFAAISEFFNKGAIPIGYNASFITLIPKIESPLVVNDFRPISLIGILYKIIAKIISFRIALIIDDIIDPVQYAFIKNRQILNGLMILNEVVHTLKSKKKKGMIFKVDIAMAYDTLSWDYLISVMRFMRLSNKCVRWIKSCLESARSSVLVNGSPTMEFQLECGLRQGEPLAPFLFILAMEGFHIAMEDAIEAKKFIGINIGDCYEIQAIRIGVTETELIHLDGLAGCKGEKLPFLYLGLPIGANMFRVSTWQPVIDKLSKRLSKWRANCLSIGEFKNVMVGDRWNGSCFAWNWRHPLRRGTEDDQYHMTCDIIKQLPSNELLDFVNNKDNLHKAKDIIFTIIYTVWWELWRFRNDFIFKPGKKKDVDIVDSII